MKFTQALLILLVLLSADCSVRAQDFVRTKNGQFTRNGKPYYYIGANYWYGGYLTLSDKRDSGYHRLLRELDFLAAHGITNLRVLVGVEGTGGINGMQRVAPPLQDKPGHFIADNLDGLDLLVAEMGKRKMKAVLFLSNNWEWSGGFLQYLNWHGHLQDSVMRRKLSWDELRDYTSRFYSCQPCISDYNKQLELIIKHKNKISGRAYRDDPAIMAWEVANEPRPMRATAIDAYTQWLANTSAQIRRLDPNHLITLGVEGDMGTENIDVYKKIHADTNVDFLTIHIWPKNWSWFKDTSITKDLNSIINRSSEYMDRHLAIAKSLGKPLVIEEFGLPRDQPQFAPRTAINARNRFYESIFNKWQTSVRNNDVLAALNFWAYSGEGKPVAAQTFWKTGDAYLGDPPVEEQGLNSVYNSDTSTWSLIHRYITTTATSTTNEYALIDRSATFETKALYRNLHKLLDKGIMFGHQDDLAYGVGWKYEPGNSDVKILTGDYPAVNGWELGNIEHDLPYDLDSVPFDRMRSFIRQNFEDGNVVTLSWHADNPLTGGSAWDTTHGAVQSILPGGIRHQLYKMWLDKVSGFIASLKDKNGASIPVLFRPFHELSGTWFWWGKNTCTAAEFESLWRFTVHYLTTTKGLHNIIWVYNLNDFNSEDELMDRYPGDNMADVISFDSYQFNDPATDSSFYKNLVKRLTILEQVAARHHKLSALAETGYEQVPYASWWTNILWKALDGHRISYVLVWRNHGRQQNGHLHYYVPVKGDISAEDFIRFYQLPGTLFQKDIQQFHIYQ